MKRKFCEGYQATERELFLWVVKSVRSHDVEEKLEKCAKAVEKHAEDRIRHGGVSIWARVHG